MSLSSMSKNAIFQLFVESYNDFKNQFFKISITELGRPFFLHTDGSPKFLLCWPKNPQTVTSWPLDEMTDIERRDFDVLVGLPRPFSSQKIVNCLKYNDFKSKVFGMFFD